MTDRINVYPSHFMLPIDMEEPLAVHSVGLSGLDEYLQQMFGDDVPHDVEARRLSQPLLHAMAELSTDESLSSEALERDGGPRYVGNKLRLVTPVVNDAKALGRFVGERLEADAGDMPATAENIRDFMYTLGLFDLSSFVVASQLALDHPRFEIEGLIKRAAAIRPESHEPPANVSEKEKRDTERLIRLMKSSHRRTFVNLQRQGEGIVRNAEGYTQRFVSLLNEIAGSDDAS